MQHDKPDCDKDKNDGVGLLCILRRYSLRASLLAMSIILAAFLAFGNVLGTILPHNALASVTPGDILPDTLSGQEKMRYAAMLRDFVSRDAGRLEVLSRSQILILLDEPDLRRLEGSFGHWQYVSDSCILDIFLKDGSEEKNAQHPVQYVDFRPRQTAYYEPKHESADQKPDREACLASLEKKSSL